VEQCIAHFITIEVIMEIPKFYFESHMEHDLKELMEEGLEINKSQKVKWEEKTLVNKGGWYLYKWIRCLYTCVLFYFFPAILLLFNFFSPLNLHPPSGGH